MADLYPESMLEDLLEAYFSEAVPADGILKPIFDAGGIYKGYDALEIETPALIFGVAGSDDDEDTGNFICTAVSSIRMSRKADALRATMSTAEKELRTIWRDTEIETLLNTKAAEEGWPIRIQFVTPKSLSRAMDGEEVVSAVTAEVEVYFADN